MIKHQETDFRHISLGFELIHTWKPFDRSYSYFRDIFDLILTSQIFELIPTYKAFDLIPTSEIFSILFLLHRFSNLFLLEGLSMLFLSIFRTNSYFNFRTYSASPFYSSRRGLSDRRMPFCDDPLQVFQSPSRRWRSPTC